MQLRQLIQQKVQLGTIIATSTNKTLQQNYKKNNITKNSIQQRIQTRQQTIQLRQLITTKSATRHYYSQHYK